MVTESQHDDIVVRLTNTIQLWNKSWTRAAEAARELVNVIELLDKENEVLGTQNQALERQVTELERTIVQGELEAVDASVG